MRSTGRRTARFLGVTVVAIALLTGLSVFLQRFANTQMMCAKYPLGQGC